MRKVLLLYVSLVGITACTKYPKPPLPPRAIAIETAAVSNEQVSVSYIDSITNKAVPIKINSLAADDNGAYAYSIPTGSFISRYLFGACSNGIRTFQLQFTKGNQVETHVLFIDFRSFPGGGFEIPYGTIDGNVLIKSPTPDSGKYGYYTTVFTYNR